MALKVVEKRTRKEKPLNKKHKKVLNAIIKNIDMDRTELERYCKLDHKDILYAIRRLVKAEFIKRLPQLGDMRRIRYKALKDVEGSVY